jgi:hypothetical protein
MRSVLFFIFSLSLLLLGSCQKPIELPENGIVKVTIKHTVKGTPLSLNSGNYTNPFGEQYTVSKFKYYISNINVVNNLTYQLNGLYFLVDESKPASLSFSFEAPATSYVGLVFMLGVDSARNVSGAQTGALDPLNDMFWTWNTGYIMAKLEGNSPQSPAVNNKMEYHIGGFSGPYAAQRWETFLIPTPPMTAINVRSGMTTEIFVEADLDKWWQGSYDLRIANEPAIMTPGNVATSIANNYRMMFKITDIKNY